MAKEKKETISEKVEDLAENIEKKAKKALKEVKKGVDKVVEEVKELTEEEKKTKKAKKDSDDSKKSKFEELKKKAKQLEGKVEDVKDLDLKKQVKPEEDEKENTLVPIEDYLKSSIHLGTRVITPDMRKYVYRRRADGLAVFNTALLDDLILQGGEYLSQFEPKDIIIICKRESGWKAVEKFAEITGTRVFTKKYPAGVLTNTTLDNFIEAELIFICDPWLDKNALEDAKRIRIPVLSICDTNNFTKGITKIIPGNNKSAKSLGMILYLLTKIYVEKHKIKTPEFSVRDFVDGWDELVPPK